MIEVHELQKDYGYTHALRGISFQVSRGEVVGFLGPNGAGKSTTMRILCGYLLPTGGTASVAGFDVVRQSLLVRRRIGYLPESTPLYGEMRVDDYLRFCAEIRGVPRGRVRQAIDRAVGLCGLQGVVGKNIVELSKGYRQRTGLAQAILHEPEVLILDEPTSGLDPNQIIEVRRLIEQLGQQHTVILSTHYLQEVEKSATRIVIVNQGRIVADDTHDNLIASLPAGPLRLRVQGPRDKVGAQLAELLPAPGAVQCVGAGEQGCDWRIDLPAGSMPLDEAVARLIVKNGWGIVELRRERGTLEDVFRELTTGRAEPQEAAHG